MGTSGRSVPALGDSEKLTARGKGRGRGTSTLRGKKRSLFLSTETDVFLIDDKKKKGAGPAGAAFPGVKLTLQRKGDLSVLWGRTARKAAFLFAI